MKKFSTSSLKTATGLFIVFGFCLMLAGPFIVHRPPHMARRAYAQRAAWYVGGILIALTGAGTGAFLLVRRAKDEYREMSMRNLKELLEASRQDHLRPKQAEESNDA